MPFFWLTVWLVMGILGCVTLLAGSVLLVKMEFKDLTKILLLIFFVPHGNCTAITHKKTAFIALNIVGLDARVVTEPQKLLFWDDLGVVYRILVDYLQTHI